MNRWIATSLALSVACTAGEGASSANAAHPEVSTADVHRFVAARQRLAPADSDCTALDTFVAAASRGQRAYFDKFDVGRKEICRELRRAPKGYGALEAKLPGLHSAAERVQQVFAKYAELLPRGRPPDVYFVVGNGIAAGATTGGQHPIVLIGMERNGAVESLAPAIAH